MSVVLTEGGGGQLRVKVKRLVPVLNMFGREMVQVLQTNQSDCPARL